MKNPFWNIYLYEWFWLYWSSSSYSSYYENVHLFYNYFYIVMYNKKLVIWSTFKVSLMIVNMAIILCSYTVLCVLFNHWLSFPNWPRSGAKRELQMPMEWAPRCHMVLSPMLETGLRLEEAQQRQPWRGLDITTEPRLGITQLCVNTFRLVSDAACRGTMGMVRGCAEDARCHTAHMSSLTYESRLNAGYWLCLRDPTGSQTFQQQQRECSEVDAARRRAPWIPKLSKYLQQHLYTALIGMHLSLRADHTTEPCIKRI